MDEHKRCRFKVATTGFVIYLAVFMVWSSSQVKAYQQPANSDAAMTDTEEVQLPLQAQDVATEIGRLVDLYAVVVGASLSNEAAGTGEVTVILPEFFFFVVEDLEQSFRGHSFSAALKKRLLASGAKMAIGSRRSGTIFSFTEDGITTKFGNEWSSPLEFKAILPGSETRGLPQIGGVSFPKIQLEFRNGLIGVVKGEIFIAEGTSAKVKGVNGTVFEFKNGSWFAQ